MHPRGVRLYSAAYMVQLLEFQSTHPRGVRPCVDTKGLKRWVFQSTHPRGVRLCQSFSLRLNTYVSIHAPARGATGVRLLVYWQRRVSIHAPARGATGPLALDVVMGKFQSTHPRGVRPLFTQAEGLKVPVSIHAPARGATLISEKEFLKVQFQSTHPRGVRRYTEQLMR